MLWHAQTAWPQRHQLEEATPAEGDTAAQLADCTGLPVPKVRFCLGLLISDGRVCTVGDDEHFKAITSDGDVARVRSPHAPASWPPQSGDA